MWTAHIFLIFTLGRINILPTNDLGLRKAIMLNYKLKKLPDEKTILKIAKRNKWSPYCTLASWYLWRSLEL
jgi:DNA-3-methyladenine glycosylase II